MKQLRIINENFQDTPGVIEIITIDEETNLPVPGSRRMMLTRDFRSYLQKSDVTSVRHCETGSILSKEKFLESMGK